jgi:hypothetical protein
MSTTMTIKQVADLYNVSTKTLKKKILKLGLGIDTSSLLYPKDLLKVFEALGRPEDHLLAPIQAHSTHDEQSQL